MYHSDACSCFENSLYGQQKKTAILNFYEPDHSEFYFPSLGISNNEHTQLEIEVDGHFPIVT